MTARLTTCLVSALVIAGCGGGGGGDLSTDLGRTTAPYLVVDLDTGAVTPSTSLPDVSQAAYRDRLMAFAGIDPNPANGATAFGGQADEVATTMAARTYVALTETTRDQWQRIARTTPWTDIAPAALAGAGSDGSLPAVGMSADEARAALTGWAPGSSRLRLPTSAEWETACRGGSTGTFAWGEARDEAVAGAYARVAETAPALEGPAPVGALAANGFGLRDVHGNVWEWTAEDAARGGSWNDPLGLARAANRLPLSSFSSHATVGLRLVLVP
jgi:hypothetical protein